MEAAKQGGPTVHEWGNHAKIRILPPLPPQPPNANSFTASRPASPKTTPLCPKPSPLTLASFYLELLALASFCNANFFTQPALSRRGTGMPT